MEMTKITILVIFLVLMSSLALADLEDYPEMMFSQGKFQGKIVVGKNAPSTDVASAIKLIPSLQELSEERIRGSMLDTDVTDTTLKNFHIISIGCENEVTKLFVECDLRSGESFIYVFNKYGYYQIVVIGGSEEDIAKATLVLGNYKNYELEGEAIRILGEELPYDIERAFLPEVDDEVLVIEEIEPKYEEIQIKEIEETYDEPETAKTQKQIELEEKLEEYQEEVEIETPELVVEESAPEIDPSLPIYEKVWIKFKSWVSWFFE